MSYNLDKRIEDAIIALAKKHGVKKVMLFGSRARGDNYERSDIDLAVSGGDVLRFSFCVDEEIPTLLSFDIVNLDEGVSDELREEISRDGICIYDEGRENFLKKYDNFIKCLEVLKNSDRDKIANDEIYRMGIIGQFNLTFELSWKALQAALRIHGAGKTGSPREIFKTAYSVGFLPDDKVWIDMLEARNTAAHVYDEAEAEKIAERIFDEYVPAFLRLAEILRKKIEEVVD